MVFERKKTERVQERKKANLVLNFLRARGKIVGKIFGKCRNEEFYTYIISVFF